MLIIKRLALLLFPTVIAIVFGIANHHFAPPLFASSQPGGMAQAMLEGDLKTVDGHIAQQLKIAKAKLDAAIADPDQTYFKRQKLMQRLSIITILAGFTSLTILIPNQSSSASKANSLTVLIVGFALANFAVGFDNMPWNEFVIWATAGFAIAFLMVLVRGRNKDPSQNKHP